MSTVNNPEALRVLLCATGFPRSVEDTHKPFLLHHAQALVAAGVEVTVLCPSAKGLPAKETIGGVEVIRFRYAPHRFETLAYDGAMYKRVASIHGLLVPVFVLSFFLAARQIARERKVHILHAHWWAPSGLVAWAAASTLRSARSVVHLHGSDAAIAKGPIRLLAKWLFRQVDAVYTVSSELASWVQTVSGVDSKVVPMPLRPDLVELATNPGGVAELAAEPWVLAVGRLVPEKGFSVLVEAAALIKLPLTIAGSGPQFEALQDQAAKLDVDLTLVGEVTPEKLVRLYQQATVVAVPSLREGFGMVAAEAAVLGKTIVGSAVGGIPNLITNDENGFLVTPGRAGDLAEALKKAIDQPEMGRAGKEKVTFLFPQTHAANLVRLYREVLEN